MCVCVHAGTHTQKEGLAVVCSLLDVLRGCWLRAEQTGWSKDKCHNDLVDIQSPLVLLVRVMLWTGKKEAAAAGKKKQPESPLDVVVLQRRCCPFPFEAPLQTACRWQLREGWLAEHCWCFQHD